MLLWHFLLTKDHHLIEFPTILLPNGVRAGQSSKSDDQDFDSEKEEAEKFTKIRWDDLQHICYKFARTTKFENQERYSNLVCFRMG